MKGGPGTAFVGRAGVKIAAATAAARCATIIGTAAACTAPCTATAQGAEVPCYTSSLELVDFVG